MKLLLEELDHQKVALDKLIKSFRGLDTLSTDPDKDYVYANPLIKYRGKDSANIDIKMETGTGKTYVYTRAIYELYQRYGLFKFILVVPSPAIKIGAKNFIENLSTKQHFSQFYENIRIDLNVLNAGDFKAKSGRKNFPAHLTNFIEGSRQNSNTIQVLLVNAGMLTSSNMTKDDFDQTLLMSETSPIEALKKTRPIVIIDEPHRFPRGKSNYQAIEALCPQMIIRLGATFPEVVEGKGKNKLVKKDYYRQKPQHDLTAVQSFYQGLVKGIDIYYPNLSEQEAKTLWQVDSVTAKKLILKKKGRSEKVELAVGDNLAEVDADFEGDITYAGSKELSSGLVLDKGMWLTPAVFRNSYQELMIEDAINKHFDKEWQNFSRPNAPRIKTLTLFFIDSISSYRDEEGWLKLTFERLLGQKLQRLIRDFSEKTGEREKDYLDFLLATQNSLGQGKQQDVHAGYFGEDSESGDDAIQRQVDDILRNKERLLSFKDEEGTWLTRRFLFSKWTLREGWDNPNVFVIAKLRTSGSETSKIQEVGRGLRLPFDETGHRVTQDEWDSRLAFLIGYDEKDFAQQLVGEVNQDSSIELNQAKLTEEMIEQIVSIKKLDDETFDKKALLIDLIKQGIIDITYDFEETVTIDARTQSGYAWLLELYPEVAGLKKGHITTNNHGEQDKVSLRLDKWEELRGLWKEFSKRRLLMFEPKTEELKVVVEEVFANLSHYRLDEYHQTVESVKAQEKGLYVEEPRTADLGRTKVGLPYGQFLKELSRRTSLPISLLHPPIVKALKALKDGAYLSEASLKRLSRTFKERFTSLYAQSYQYQTLDFYGRTSIFDGQTGQFIEKISSGLLGKQQLNRVGEDERYLYDRPPLYFDSIEPEKTLLTHNYDSQIKIYGKLPQAGIKVPRYTGGTTTPDFIYAVDNGDNRLCYLLVEGKAKDMRQSDQEIVQIQEKFFSGLPDVNIQYTVATEADDVYEGLRKLLNQKEQ